MFKCNCCGCVFFEPANKKEISDCVPSPFGIGNIQIGGGDFDCCPECNSYDFDKLYFDGIHCPYCGEIIDLSCIKDENNYDYVCKKCYKNIIVTDGELNI